MNHNTGRVTFWLSVLMILVTLIFGSEPQQAISDEKRQLAQNAADYPRKIDVSWSKEGPIEDVTDTGDHCFRRNDILVLKVILMDEAFHPATGDRYYAKVCASDQEVIIPLEEYVLARIWIGRHRFQEPHLIQRNAPLRIYFERKGQRHLLNEDVSIPVKTLPPEAPSLYAIPKGNSAEFVWARHLSSEREVVFYDIERQTRDGTWQSVSRIPGAGPLACRVASPVWGESYRVTLKDWAGYTVSSPPLRLEKACESNTDIFYMISTTSFPRSGCFAKIVSDFKESLHASLLKSGKTWQTTNAGCAKEIYHFHLTEERLPHGFRFIVHDDSRGDLLYTGKVVYPETPQCTGLYELDRKELLNRLNGLFPPVPNPKPERALRERIESTPAVRELSLEEAEAYCKDQRGLMKPWEWLDRYGPSPEACRAGEYVAGGLMRWDEDKSQWVFEPLFQPQVRHPYSVRCRGDRN